MHLCFLQVAPDEMDKVGINYIAVLVLSIDLDGYTIRIRQHRKGKCASPTPSRNRKVFAPIKLLRTRASSQTRVERSRTICSNIGGCDDKIHRQDEV
jgi:hypothetical protein